MAIPRIYPPDWSGLDCPPADSLTADGQYYRAVEHNPPTDQDFLNAVEAEAFLKACPCDRLAVSMLSTWEGAVHHLTLFPWRAKWNIAISILNSDHGKVKNTPSKNQPKHVDWWPYPDVIREETVTEVRKP